MWWTAELVKGPPLSACIVVFGSVHSNMLKRAVSLVITGDQSKVSNHLQWGFSLHCTSLGWVDLALVVRHKEEGVNFREEDTPEGTLLFFYLFWSAMCKHQWHTVRHLIYSWLHVGQLWKVSYWAIKSEVGLLTCNAAVPLRAAGHIPLSFVKQVFQ